MVTAVQVKSYLRPLLDQNSDLALVGRLLVVKPVHHVLRGVMIDRRSSAEVIAPVRFLHHMFAPRLSYSLAWSNGFWGRVWRTTDPDVGDALCQAVQSEALAKLRAVKTIEDFVETMPSSEYGHSWQKIPADKLLFDIALGDIGSAQALCRDRLMHRPEPGPKEDNITKAEWAGTQKLCRLIAREDVPGAIAQLHEWEQQTTKNLKIEHLWEATPFPVEEKLGIVT